MSEIVYPVRSATHYVEDEVGCLASTDCAFPRRQHDVARRIAAALNATRHLTVEQLEAVPPDVMEVAVRYMVDNSGDAAKGE